MRADDDDDNHRVVAASKNYSDETIKVLPEFMERWLVRTTIRALSAILRKAELVPQLVGG